MAKKAGLNHKQFPRTLSKRKVTKKDRRKAAFRALDGFFHEAANSTEMAEVFLKPTDTIPFKFAGQQEYVTTSDINTYSKKLTDNHIAAQIAQKKGLYTFRMTDRGLIEMKKSGFSSSKPISQSTNVISNDIRTRQKPVGSDPGRGIASKPVVNVVAPAPVIGPLVLPLASAMCIPILQAISVPIKFKRLIALVAAHFNFDTALVTLPLPRDTNQTFVLRLQTATDYLIKHGYLAKTGKLFAITASGADLILNNTDAFRDFVEPRLKAKTTVVIDLPKEARAAFHALNTDVAKVISGFATADAEKLIAIYRNAERILKEPNRDESHLKAQAVIHALGIEFANRTAAAPEDERFKWPTTEAHTGNGASTLLLPKTQAEGMLAHLEYRVGRTHGAQIATRRNILRRIFENSLPDAFDKAYMDEWGSNGSASRLRKIAESIAAFTRNAKRRDADRLHDAIQHWEQDLKYLRDWYYVGKFSFGWPTTTIDLTKNAGDR
jgi:hypothetical protein